MSDSEQSLLLDVWKLLLPHERRTAVILFGMMIIGMFMETLGVGLVIPAFSLLVDDAAAEKYPVLVNFSVWFGEPDKEKLVIIGMLLLVSVYIVKALYLAVLAWKQTRFTYGVQEQLSRRLFERYLHKPYVFHLQHNSAELIRNATTEVNLFSGNIVTQILFLLTDILIAVGLLGLLLWVEPIGTLFVIITFTLASFIYYSISHKRIVKWGKLRQLHEGLRIRNLQEGFGGAKNIKLYGKENEFIRRYNIHNHKSADMGRLQSVVQFFPRLWLEVVAIITITVLVITMISQGHTLEEIVPILAVFAAAAFRMLPSVNRVINAVQGIKYALPVVHVLKDEFSSVEVVCDEKKSSDNDVDISFEEIIRLHNVSYIYPGASDYSLKKINLKIKKGQSIGVVGPSGAGKSTLVDILLGLLYPNDGVVEVDGCDIHKSLRQWQNKIGYVPQSIFLTDDTLRNNIAFGVHKSMIDEAKILRAVVSAKLDEFVNDLPEGLDTVVGERGVRLSGGQCQRIGIARALYNDPEVLVLDEATSALDMKTEKDVMSTVRTLHGIKTTVIITHRLSTVEYCDYVYKIDAGELHNAG